MALKSVLVTADGGRKVVELSSQNALSLQPGERLLIPDGLERLPVAPGSEFDNAMMLQDAEGQQYSIFLSADTEVVVAEAEDLQVAEAETPDAEYEDLSRPGGAPETAPVEDVGAPPNVVGDPPPPVGPQNYGANPNSPVVYEQDQGAGNFVLPMLGGIIGAGALIALANENEDESDERREESPAPNAPPIIASNGGGDSAQISIAENNQAVTTVSALDPDLNAVSYGLAGGADAALFSINSITGALSLLNPPDFENPLDAGGDNVYEVSVLATDGVLADFQSLSVQVVNSGSEPNQAPVITSGDDDLFALNIAEQAELNVAITAQDPDGDDITLSVIGGADANRFVFDADTGLLTLPAQDFENPLDANGDNRYVIVIQAADEQDADAQIVIVTVTDIDDGDPNLNLAPVITSNGGGVSAVVPVAENTTAVTQVVASDANGDAITYSIAGGADAGLFSVDANTGALSFNAAPDFEMPADANADNDYFVVVSASDGVLSDAQALTVSVTDVVEMAPNNPPVAVNDAASTDQDMAVTIVNVLLNDSDPDQALTAANINAFSQGGNGSVASNGDGSFLYTPNAGFSGVDSFSYTVTDDQGASDTATVTVTVNAAGGGNTAPVAVADSYNVVQDTAFMIDAVGGVLANDSDAENDTLSAALVSDVASGSLSLATDGSFSYTPNGGFTGTDSFSYKASDGTVDGNTVSVSLTVLPQGANQPPTAVDDGGAGFITDEGSSFTAASVLANDSDPEGDTLSIISINTTGTQGLVTDNKDGTFSYDPNGQFESLNNGETATDTFTYTISDGNGNQDSATVSISITGVTDVGNQPPTAVDDGGAGFITDEDSSFTTGNVLSNDTDPEGDTLSVVSFDTTGTLGLVTKNSDGSFNYDPNGRFENLDAGESFTDSFTYTISDGNGNQDTATVEITVDGREEVPVGPVFSILPASDIEGTTGSDPNFLNFEVRLSETSIDAVTVEYRLLAGSGNIGSSTGGDAYFPNSTRTLTFAPGETSQVVNVRINGDGTDEPDEFVVLELFNAAGASFAGGASTLRATGTILDDDNIGNTLALFTSNPFVREGDVADIQAVFELRLSQAHGSDLTVNYQTVDGSAVAGSDYTSTSGSVTFLAGQTTANVFVPVLGDITSEASERFSLVVSPGTAPLAEVVSAEATILDDDTGNRTISISPVSDLEGTTGSDPNFLRFEVRLSETSIDAVTVEYRLLAGSGNIGSSTGGDAYFPNSTRTLTFAPGETSQVVNVRVNGDGTDEPDEFVVLELFNAAGASFAGGASTLRATGTILDDDNIGNTLALFTSNPFVREGDVADIQAVFELRLSQAHGSDLTVNYQTVDGSAVAGSDYTSTSGSVTFLAGQTTANVFVPVLGDITSEASERFSLVVSPGTAPLAEVVSAEATILDDDTGNRTISISPVSDLEGTTGSDPNFLRFEVRLSETSINAVTVEYRLLAGSGNIGSSTGGDAYFPNSTRTLTFAPGETSQVVNVRVNGDGTDEPDEFVVLELFNATNASFAGGASTLRATGTILDDDTLGNTLALFTSNPTLLEGDSGTTDAVFELRLSQASDSDLTVTYQTVNGSAVAGSDYTSTSGSVTFLAGQTTANVFVPVIGDMVNEASESFSLIVAPNAALAQVTSGQATILNDDASGSASSAALGQLLISGPEGEAFDLADGNFALRYLEQSGGPDSIINFDASGNGSVANQDLIDLERFFDALNVEDADRSEYVEITAEGGERYALRLDLDGAAGARLGGTDENGYEYHLADISLSDGAFDQNDVVLFY